ncbi:HTTM domain-containing protein [Hymenobacter arizonensis]|uniref:Vitamin K-dependent gamma-carboxylase n=1 Tax=Hymenobacter arizonensis TaxID=1227077 RepID=A0A1I6ASH6_HYMAR|nr:HTTM domain-containing protein [Hymenobacter arizonensis]SFQ71643.1 Vitamin K-dependent gamma-carboxylase [Hymenobacter arizonensis]
MSNTGTGFWGVLRRPFVLDLRALALLRMATAAVLLTDLAIRSTDLEAHYSNMGVLPLSTLHSFGWTAYQFSLHAASGMWQVQALLFLATAALSVALLLGYHTRLATVGAWLLLVSLQNRNPFIGQGGDDLLRMLLFWGIFLPWGRVWSADARNKPAPARYDYFSAATVAYIVQLALLYWCTALLKSGTEWTQTGTALYYAFSLDQVLLPAGRWLYPYPELLRFLTFGAYFTELLLPFALFIPVWVPWWRMLVVGVLVVFHFTISVTLFVGIFFLVNLASILGLLPTGVLDWLTLRLGPLAARVGAWRFRLPAWPLPWRLRLERTGPVSAQRRVQWRTVREAFVAVVLAYVCWWNLDDVAMLRPAGGIMPQPVRWFGYLLRVDQHWGMFAPTVFKDDGWYILEGTTADGRQVDLNRRGQPVSYAKPASVVALFKNDRWRKYSENYLFVNNAWMRPYYCNYLLRIWHENADHPALRHLLVVYMKEVSLPDYKLATPTRQVLCECELVAGNK